MNITVFAGSRLPRSETIVREARLLGRMIAERGHVLVFGGTGSGLMALAAQEALAAGGTVLGVYAEVLREVEPPMHGMTRMETFATLAERRSRLIEIADVIVALPGGIGTLDEITEAVALFSLGEKVARTVMIDIEGFFGPFVAQLELQRQLGLAPPESDRWIARCDSSRALFELLAKA